MSGPRLRQLVFVCEDLSKADQLKILLGLGEAYADPGVAFFGLDNAVFALGDQFLEIIAPQPGKQPEETAAGRFLERNGPGGYMAIFEIPDIDEARSRADGLGIRRVWNADLPEISASHFHPADVGGAILSVDQPKPAGSWLWGGPDWQKNSVPGKLTGAVVEAHGPLLAEKWSQALDCTIEGEKMALLDGSIQFVEADKTSLAQFNIAHPDVEGVLARAGELGLSTSDETITFESVRLNLQLL